MTTFDPGTIKRNDNKVRCASKTESGEACRAWAIHGSSPPICSTHARLTGGGAPKGNQNALKHGFYARSLSDQESADLVGLMASGELDDELAMTRVLIRRVWDRINDPKQQKELSLEDFKTLAQLHFLGVRTVAGLLKAGGPATTFQDVLGAVLDDLSNSWGTKL
jgi:hypothetical protein